MKSSYLATMFMIVGIVIGILIGFSVSPLAKTVTVTELRSNTITSSTTITQELGWKIINEFSGSGDRKAVAITIPEGTKRVKVIWAYSGTWILGGKIEPKVTTPLGAMDAMLEHECIIPHVVFYKGDKWEKDAPTLLLSKASGELTFYLMPGEYKIDLSGFETKRRKIDWLIRIEIEK